jgi:hypothetical protein
MVDTIAVTDTLIIDAILTGAYPPDDHNLLKIYPNPTKEYVVINTGDFSRMVNYTLRIRDILGTTVFETLIQQQLYEINLSTWTGKGTYLVELLDGNGRLVSLKKLILQ